MLTKSSEKKRFVLQGAIEKKLLWLETAFGLRAIEARDLSHLIFDYNAFCFSLVTQKGGEELVGIGSALTAKLALEKAFSELCEKIIHHHLLGSFDNKRAISACAFRSTSQEAFKHCQNEFLQRKIIFTANLSGFRPLEFGLVNPTKRKMNHLMLLTKKLALTPRFWRCPSGKTEKIPDFIYCEVGSNKSLGNGFALARQQEQAIETSLFEAIRRLRVFESTGRRLPSIEDMIQEKVETINKNNFSDPIALSIRVPFGTFVSKYILLNKRNGKKINLLIQNRKKAFCLY